MAEVGTFMIHIPNTDLSDLYGVINTAKKLINWLEILVTSNNYYTITITRSLEPPIRSQFYIYQFNNDASKLVAIKTPDKEYISEKYITILTPTIKNKINSCNIL